MRIESFVTGFMSGLKPQLTAADQKLLSLILQNCKPFTYSIRNELNSSKPNYYFRFQHSHLNVLLPTWILNGRKSSSTDRFRIGFTADHSVIVDTKETIIYDPTTEAVHLTPEYQPYWIEREWRNETAYLLREALSQNEFTVKRFSERIADFPALYESFVGYIASHHLKNAVGDFRFNLDLSKQRQETESWEIKKRALIEAIMAELQQRSRQKSS